ncbi:MAG: type II secretion system protein [Gammaproteobacteria bacterium]|nr:type II secretion system protein [Gammaproteobacteria bacterium]
MKSARQRSGFTLIEMVVTVAIVGLLATVAMPLAELGVRRHREQELRLALREIRDGIDRYKQATENGHVLLDEGATGYPPSLLTLVEGVEDARDPEGRRMYFLRRIPADPFSDFEAARPEETWGLRAYDTPADAPAPGEDVYDVYSLSAGTGMNGVPYREW